MLARLRSAPAKAALVVAALAASSCGGATSDLSAPSTPYVITILNYTFQPADLAAPPGTTVLVQNRDSFDHWLKSAAAPGQYVYATVGGISVDLYVPARTERSFALPANAVVGTVVPYFCFLHTSAMLNQGSITIAATAAAASGTP